MLWQVHEPHIAKSDFPQFPDGVWVWSAALIAVASVFGRLRAEALKREKPEKSEREHCAAWLAGIYWEL